MSAQLTAAPKAQRKLYARIYAAESGIPAHPIGPGVAEASAKNCFVLQVSYF
jgi:hypothetical protein